MTTTQNIPYMPTPGSITKILEKIKQAETPINFNPDFLGTKLGFKGGNNRMFISWAKKTGLLNSDGTPTALYKQYRNPQHSEASLATALKNGYSELYSRNEYCHELDKKGFKGLVVEATGEPENSAKVKMIVATFFNAKSLANFDANPNFGKPEEEEKPTEKPAEKNTQQVKLGLNYTINLTLPKTDDPAVYNAIFKSLKDNLLHD
ncbi:MAG: DUF5343 domain-containing protein [Patescibacteria group bacterium]|jgi:hypothetical protein